MGAQRIIFIDGPAVLDSRLWHDNAPGVALIQHSLERLAAAGFIADQPFTTLSRLLWGAFLEAGLYIAYADDLDNAQQEMASGLEQLFGRLLLRSCP